MSKHFLLGLVVLIAGGLYALWQGQTKTTIVDAPVVEAVAVDADGVIAISGSLAQDCVGLPKTDVSSYTHNLDIRLYRERSSLATCGMQTSPFTIKLAAEPGADSSALIINGEVWARSLVDPTVGASYETQSLLPVQIEEASLALDRNGDLLLSLRGNQAVGCDLPELYTMRDANRRVLIGVYNAVRADVACPDMLAEVNASIRLPATDLPVDTLFEVNSFLIEEVEANSVSDSDKVLTNIMSVNINVMESLPAQISLDIEGEHPDGCDLPVHVEQARAGNLVQVDIYRIVPADLICPMILQPYQGTIQLEGNFDSGKYTINVNSHSQSLNI